MPPRLRAVIWLLLAAFMFGGPFYRQALGGKNKQFRRWAMYRYFGVDICRVQYVEVLPDGTQEPIDRLAELNYEDWRDAPRRSVRRLQTPTAARRQGAQLCRARGAEDVRMYLYCGKKDRGWVAREKGKDNLCRGK